MMSVKNKNVVLNGSFETHTKYYGKIYKVQGATSRTRGATKPQLESYTRLSCIDDEKQNKKRSLAFLIVVTKNLVLRGHSFFYFSKGGLLKNSLELSTREKFLKLDRILTSGHVIDTTHFKRNLQLYLLFSYVLNMLRLRYKLQCTYLNEHIIVRVKHRYLFRNFVLCV